MSEILKETHTIAVKQRIPVRMLLELTRKCNLECSHCYIENRNNKELDTRELKNLLAQLAEEGCLTIIFTGGEPLFRPDWFELAQYARKMRFILRIYTNGTLITDAVADKLKEIQPLSVEISIYGSKAETHDRITGITGSFEASMKGLKRCRKRDLQVRIKYPVMKENITEYKRVIEHAKNLGVKYAISPNIVPKNNGDVAPMSHQISREQLTQFFSEFEVSDTKEIKKEPADKRKGLTPCDAGMSTGFISSLGDLYPCGLLLIKLGNIRRAGFEEIWYNSQKVKEFLDLRQREVKVCSTCDKAGSVCPRCPGLALREDGDFLGPSKRACETCSILEELSSAKNGKGGGDNEKTIHTTKDYQ